MESTLETIDRKVMQQAYQLIYTAKTMSEHYEANFKFVSTYVHATSRGHEAIQVALGMQLRPEDYLSAYYRDDAMLLAIGMSPYQLMLQLMAKIDDPFSGGRAYYCHPSLKDPDKPKIPHQSSATGMQAIPTTGVAMGLRYREQNNMAGEDETPVVICSLGDASMTEGEVAEALQMASLKQLPILFLVQDNEWDISAHSSEVRAMNAFEYVQGFPGIEGRQVKGYDFASSYREVRDILQTMRVEKRPFLLHAEVPLLNHHTSGVRKEWYRDDLEQQTHLDPYPRIRQVLLEEGFDPQELDQWEVAIRVEVAEAFERARQAPEPHPEDLLTHVFATTPIQEEQGVRAPTGGKEVVMVDAALHAIDELMRKHPECLLYGQDVGRRLGGVFREAATLAEKYGDHRVFNTPIQEAFIIGSTVGMSAVGLKPIVEVQFADYMWPGLNQLFTEVSRSCYLSNGKWPVSCIIRVPIGAYVGGGPYHSSSIESVVTNIRGIKIAYPSNGADLKGLMKAAYYDPNPVVIFEHKGLYWSKVPGTEKAKCVDPAEDYLLPFGKGRMVLEAGDPAILVVTYGMGVYWAAEAAKSLSDKIGILDLRTLYPLDEVLIREQVARYHKVLVLTEEPPHPSFAQSLAGWIQQECFRSLDAPVRVLGSRQLPAIPLNRTLEVTMLPNPEKVLTVLQELIDY
ncbi:MAG: thiamine pyrophosphate-dependent enzyme [Saprospiraceae bacterium]